MDNENKDFELESQEMGSGTTGVELNAEVAEEAPQEAEVDFTEEEFDPTLSDEFYNNLDAAIGGQEEPEEEELPELLLGDELFSVGEQQASQSTLTAAEEDMFAGVDAALTEQIEHEFGKAAEISSTEEETKPNKFVSVWKAIPTWTKVLVSIILVVLVSVGLLFGTAGGRDIVYKVIVSILFDKINIEDPNEGIVSPAPNLTVTVAPDLTGEPTPIPTVDPNASQEPTTDPGQNPDTTPKPTDDPNVTPEPTVPPTPSVKILDDENIINVLLLGEENMYGANRGRTDAIIVVSVDLNGGPLKMVSFQRDMYVSIPGYPDDKLNSAYTKGGAKLVMATIEQNFGIDIDSYVKVGFDGFENIIDQLGGLRLSLTAKESEFLNTKGYISKPEERNTVAGEQILTGAQVLGYCRDRFTKTANGLANDFARNYRHRVVLQAIFDQYKEKNLVELMSVMNQCFKYVSAPAELETLAQDCLKAVMENKMFDIETMQMPQSGKYTDKTIDGKDVIVFYPEAVDLLQDFLYGE